MIYRVFAHLYPLQSPVNRTLLDAVRDLSGVYPGVANSHKMKLSSSAPHG